MAGAEYRLVSGDEIVFSPPNADVTASVRSRLSELKPTQQDTHTIITLKALGSARRDEIVRSLGAGRDWLTSRVTLLTLLLPTEGDVGVSGPKVNNAVAMIRSEPAIGLGGELDKRVSLGCTSVGTEQSRKVGVR